MKHTPIVSYIVLTLMLMLLTACGRAAAPTLTEPPQPVSVAVSGSSEMAPLLVELRDVFQNRYPYITVNVEGINSAAGLAQVRQSKADLGALTVDPPDELWVAPVALDGIAIVVHPDNPLDDLTLAQLRDLLSGRAWRWSDLGVQVTHDEVTVISREEGSGTRAALEKRVMEGAAVTSAAVVMPGSEAVLAYVAAHPGAIGYVSAGLVSEQVKAVRIEGVSPEPKNVADNSYYLIRPFYLVALQEPTGAARQFVDFCLSAEGQAVVARRHVPVR